MHSSHSKFQLFNGVFIYRVSFKCKRFSETENQRLAIVFSIGKNSMELTALLDRITTNDISDDSNEVSLKKFGDFLREDSVRSSPEVRDSIPAVIKIANSKITQIIESEHNATDSSLVLEVLRVLINFLANNDDNRQFLASTDMEYKATFWNLLCKLFGLKVLTANSIHIYERTLLMLTQFIHNTKLLKEFIVFFSEIGMGKCLIAYLKFRNSPSIAPETGFDELAIPTELYSEFITEMSEKTATDKTFANECIEYLEAIIMTFNFALGLGTDEEDEDEMETINDVFSNLANIIYNITLCEDIPNISSTQVHANILQLIPQIPRKMLNFTLNKRRLFSSSGNIASMTNYDNSVDVPMALEYFYNPETDPYILSACAIDLGNYITTVEKAEWLKEQIDAEMSLKKFVENFYKIKFNDVIQYQAFHLFNNLMSRDIALYSFDHYDSLLKSSKVIIDNSQYYKEVFNIYAKFIKKLIRFEFIGRKDHDRNIFQFKDLWSYFNPQDHPGAVSEEVYLILTQAFIATKLLETKSLIHEDTPFVTVLLENLVSDKGLNNEVSSTFLLEKLKTLGIFFKAITNHDINGEVIANVLYDSSPDQYILHFVTPYHNFLQKLQGILDQEHISNNTNNPNQFDIIQNNSKFVCATTLAYFSLPHESSKTVDSIQSICQYILKINHAAD